MDRQMCNAKYLWLTSYNRLQLGLLSDAQYVQQAPRLDDRQSSDDDRGTTEARRFRDVKQ